MGTVTYEIEIHAKARGALTIALPEAVATACLEFLDVMARSPRRA